MTNLTVEVDRTRPVSVLPGQRGIPALIDGLPAIAVFQDFDYGELMKMASIIRKKRPNYTDDEAVAWATRRAVDDQLLKDGIIRIERHHVG
jgi:hypothetical protein